MSGDQLYARSMGTTYDPDALQREIEDGISTSARDDTPAYEVDGSDLYIANPEEMISKVESYLRWLEYKSERTGVSITDLDSKMFEEAQYIQSEFQRRLDELSEKDVLYAHAIQDWVLDELRQREAGREEPLDPQSEDTYHETVAVLDMLIEELTDEAEDEKLIQLAAVWRQETLAELDVAALRRFYALAA